MARWRNITVRNKKRGEEEVPPVPKLSREVLGFWQNKAAEKVQSTTQTTNDDQGQKAGKTLYAPSAAATEEDMSKRPLPHDTFNQRRFTRASFSSIISYGGNHILPTFRIPSMPLGTSALLRLACLVTCTIQATDNVDSVQRRSVIAPDNDMYFTRRTDLKYYS